MYVRSTYVCMYVVRTYACMYIRTYVCLYIYVYIYICMYVRTYVRMCICVHMLRTRTHAHLDLRSTLNCREAQFICKRIIMQGP